MTAVVSAPVSVVDEGAMAAVDVLPNPASDLMVVRLPGDREVTITMVDAAGQDVMQRTVMAGTTEASVGIAGLAPGMYIVVVRGNGVAKTIPVVIVR
jgi:hypothetical protein